MQLALAISPERQAVALVAERDGFEAGIAYAHQSMRALRMSVLTSTRGNLFHMRWLRSYQEFKRIVLENA